MPKIVLIDDDKFWAVGTIRELDKRFVVVYLQHADEVVGYFGRNFDADGIVLDIMMPAPEGMDSQTEEGHLTGVWLLEQLRGFVLSANVPVIALTNHYDMPAVTSRIDAITEMRRHVTVHGKYGVARQELPALIAARIAAVKGIGIS